MVFSNYLIIQWGIYFELEGFYDTVERVLTYQISYSTRCITTATAHDYSDIVTVREDNNTSCKLVWYDRYVEYMCYPIAFWHSIGY